MPIVAGARSACRSTLPSLEGALSVTATVPLPQRTTKRPGCRPAGVSVAYKLLEAVQARRRRLNGRGFGALVRAGTEFIDGKLQERDDYERKFGGAPPAKAVNRSSPLARRDTVAPPTAGHDRDDDIIQLAFAILDEELRSWVKTRHRGHASQAEGVLEPHKQSGDAS